jgi:tetratricopeptide (TPR) repeat protein
MKSKFRIFILIILPLFIFSCKPGEKLSGKQEKKNGKPADNTSVYYDATKAYITGNYEEAEKLYKKCIELNNDDAAAMFELAKLSLMKNNRHEALIYARQATKIDPDNKFYMLLYGSLLQSFEQYDAAVDVFKKVLELNPNNPDYYNRLAIAYIYAGKNDKAIETFDELEEKIGITEEISMKKKDIYLQEGKPEKAIEEIEKLVAQYPKEVRYYGVLAEMYLNNGMNEKALETYRKIEELDPDDPYIHVSLADYYKKNREFDKAFEELKTGFSNKNLDIDTKVQILLSYYTANEYYEDNKDEAFQLAEILIKVHPGNPKAWSIYGDLLYQDDRFEDARTAFRKVISMDSSKYVVWEQLLFIESRLEDNDALLNESLRTIDLFPEMPLPYLFAGGVYYMKKEWQKCVDVLSVGVNYVVNNPQLKEQFLTYLGDAYNQVGDNQKSDKCYDEVLEINPDNDFVLNNYAYYLSLRNERLEKAAEMAKRSTELKPNSPANLDTYGWVLYKQKNYSDAEYLIKQALDKGGDKDADVLEHYGDVLWKLNRKDEALQYWEKAKNAGGGGSKNLDRKIEEKKLVE